MTSDPAADGWFRDVDPGDLEGAREAIEDGRADEPRDWPEAAIESGFAADAEEYYDRLHKATTAATRASVQEQEAAADRRLIHMVRAMDDCRRLANELAERLAEWGSSVGEGGTGVEYARAVVAGEANVEDPAISSLAGRVVDLADEGDRLEEEVERLAASVTPNLAALAGPVLGARLCSLAGGLESLAKKPSGTVQVLGAEDALFAHLRGQATSPKHGVIYTHDAVRGTRPEDRGSAARALAGKLSIAARVDHYSGDLRPELETELAERIETIQARAGSGAGEGEGDA